MNKNPEIKNEKPNTYPPTTSSSLKKLTILWLDKLLKPNKKVPIDFIQNLDSLPLPAYDLVDVDRYMMLQSKGFSPRPYEWGKRAFSL